MGEKDSNFISSKQYTKLAFNPMMKRKQQLILSITYYY